MKYRQKIFFKKKQVSPPVTAGLDKKILDNAPQSETRFGGAASVFLAASSNSLHPPCHRLRLAEIAAAAAAVAVEKI